MICKNYISTFNKKINMIPLYIDPGAGSLLIQVLIAGAVSVFMFFKNIKLVVSSFFNKIFKSNKKND